MPENQPLFLHSPSADDIAREMERPQYRRFPAGTTVIAEGASLRAMYVIQSGSADIFIRDRYNVDHRIGSVGPGETLGEMALFTGQPASATVRAVSDLVALVLNEADVQRLAATQPELYRHLGAVLARRLAQANRRQIRDSSGRVTLLVDHGAPPLLGYALACSVAWHTRAPTALLVVGEPPADLAALATAVGPWSASHAGAGSAQRDARNSADSHVRLLVATPDNSGADGSVARLVDTLCAEYDHVLVQVQPIFSTLLPGRAVRLAGLHEVLPQAGNTRPGHTIRAWLPVSRPARPDSAGVLWIPPLGPSDHESLRAGVLPASTAAGRALGWSARDLAGLKVGLALGAGAAKGYAHLGVLGVLERAGLTIDYLTGTSVGATTAALYALGYPVEAAAHAMDHVSAVAFRLTLSTTGLFSNAGLRAHLQRIAGHTRIEDLDMPLAVIAVDITSGREIVFRRGLLWTAVLASMSIPGVFPPQRIGPYTLVDGGVLNPVPSSVPATMGADVVIAVKLLSRPTRPALEAEAQAMAGRPPAALPVLLASLELMQCKITTDTAAAAAIVVEPIFADGGRVALRNFSQGRRYIAVGEAAAEAALPRIMAALPWLRA